MPNLKDDLTAILSRAKRSLVDFVAAFVADVQSLVRPARFHRWLSDALLKRKNNIAVQGFRESGKTTYVVYGFPLYALTFPHRSRSYIVLIKANDDLAKNKLKEIADMYLSNPIMSANVQKVYRNGDVFDVALKEGVRVRIEAYGKGVNIRGLSWQSKRPDIVIMDDVQTLDDVNSQTVAEKDWQWFTSDVVMAGRNTRIFMIGNNLGDRCIIQRLEKTAEDFGFEFKRIPAIEDGKPTWPARFPMEELMREKRAYEKNGLLDVWYRERMCQSVSSETAVFKRQWFRYYSQLPPGRLVYYTAVDLAVSQNAKADYTVILTMAINEDNRRFIVDIDYGRYTLDETIDKVFRHVRDYTPAEVAVESVAFQSVMEQVLQKEMFRTGVFFKINKFVPKGKKEMRVLSLQPLYANQAIFHKQDALWLTELESELTMFTVDGAKSEHDDLIDALAMCNSIARAPTRRRVSSRLQRKAKMA